MRQDELPGDAASSSLHFDYRLAQNRHLERIVDFL
jgi:hypothetical protein